MTRLLTRGLGALLVAVIGVLLYALCIDMFSGYPQYYTDWLSRAGIAVLVLFGIGGWVWHARTGGDGDSD